jgi:hypothetical protein
VNVSKNVMLTPVGGLGDNAYYLAVSDQVGLAVKKAASAFNVAFYRCAWSQTDSRSGLGRDDRVEAVRHASDG